MPADVARVLAHEQVHAQHVQLQTVLPSRAFVAVATHPDTVVDVVVHAYRVDVSAQIVPVT